MAHYYPKIYAPFARNSANDKYVDTKKWSKPEFEALKDIYWQWTAKADGTNIRVYWNGDKAEFFGHTDRSQLSEKTLKYLNCIFGTPEAESVFEDLYGSQPVNVYGEFCSSEMNQSYGHPDGIFYPFDVQNAENGQWWERRCVHEFAEKFGLKEAPLVFRGTIQDAVNYVVKASTEWNKTFEETYYKGCKIFCPFADSTPLEGLVGRPPVEMQNVKGERIVCKVKCRDFLCDDRALYYAEKDELDAKFEKAYVVGDKNFEIYGVFSNEKKASDFMHRMMRAFPLVFKQNYDDDDSKNELISVRYYVDKEADSSTDELREIFKNWTTLLKEDNK